MADERKKEERSIAPTVETEKPRYVRQYVMNKRHRKKYNSSRPEPIFTETEIPEVHFKDEVRIADEIAQKEKRRKAKLILFACMISLLVVLAYPIIRLVISQFEIKEIVVEGVSPYTAEQLLAASGLSLGDKLFGQDSDALSAKTLEALAYLRSCKVETRLPDKICFKVESGEAVIYTDVAGEYYALSAELRVLERNTDPSTFVASGLVYASLPQAKLSVVGEYLELSGDVSSSYITEILDAIAASDFNGRVSRLFLEEKFDIVISVDAKYRLKLGSPSSVPLKLLAASRVIAESGFSLDERAIIDVIDPQKPTALKKADLDINLRSD